MHPKFVKGFSFGFIAGILTTLYTASTLIKYAITRMDEGVTGESIPPDSEDSN